MDSFGRRTFEAADQHRFAALSGDYNPLHLDALAARRTMAGEPVVHGIHLLLWALDAFARSGEAPPLCRMYAQFASFVGLGEEVEAVVARRVAESVRLHIVRDGRPRCDIALTFGDPATAGTRTSADLPEIAPGDVALDHPEAAIEGYSGRVPFAAPPAAIAEAFPAAAAWLGAERLAALAASTRLVGMIQPGLHSIYVGLKLDLVDPIDSDPAITFVLEAPRHRLLRTRIGGGGVKGTIDAMMRPRPVAQPDMATIAKQVSDGVFSGQHVLVIGGSRGIGEVVAKLAAAGGAEVTITYHSGRVDAEAVVETIVANGGRAHAIPYAIDGDAATQLAGLIRPPTHAYYFATPTIARPASRFFDAERLRGFEHYFVQGFWNLASALRGAEPVALFYPSTVYVAHRPRGMAEYAMAKAAGELLAAEIAATMPPLTVRVERLPRLATDQTGGEDAAPVADVMAPLVRAFQGAVG